jgi:hypothetical protein
VKSLHSVDHIERLVEIVNGYVRSLFGALGSGEFAIDRFDFDDDAEIWDVKLMRTVNGKRLNYEMSIDNHTGELLSFGRRRR